MEQIPKVDSVIDAAASPSVLSGITDGLSSRQLIEHNLSGTVNVLEFCKRNRSGLVLFSTSRVYSIKPLIELDMEVSGQALRVRMEAHTPPGLSPNGVTERFSTSPPVSLYGSSKVASEVLALEYGATFDFPVWINRCGVLAGAGQFGRTDQGILAFWINSYLRRKPLKYIGFGGRGHQVRDCLHPRDLVPLLTQQLSYNGKPEMQTQNVGGGITHAISLAELSVWCEARFGAHPVASDPQTRPYDIPWMVLDSSMAKQVWGWEPQTSLESILQEIALHAEQHPDWLQISAAL
jgi:CDP-paratose 2-epimerase